MSDTYDYGGPWQTYDPSQGYAPAGGAYGFAGSPQDAQGILKQKLQAAGYGPSAVAGIAYNIGKESGWNPNLRHPDQPHFGGEAHFAHGLFQDGGTEWNNYQQFLNGRDWTDPSNQADFVIHRLNTAPEYQQTNASLRDPGVSPEQAASAFMNGYLKPAGWAARQRQADINQGIGNGFSPTSGAPLTQPPGGRMADDSTYAGGGTGSDNSGTIQNLLQEATKPQEPSLGQRLQMAGAFLQSAGANPWGKGTDPAEIIRAGQQATQAHQQNLMHLATLLQSQQNHQDLLNQQSINNDRSDARLAQTIKQQQLSEARQFGPKTEYGQPYSPGTAPPGVNPLYGGGDSQAQPQGGQPQSQQAPTNQIYGMADQTPDYAAGVNDDEAYEMAGMQPPSGAGPALQRVQQAQQAPQAPPQGQAPQAPRGLPNEMYDQAAEAIRTDRAGGTSIQDMRAKMHDPGTLALIDDIMHGGYDPHVTEGGTSGRGPYGPHVMNVMKLASAMYGQDAVQAAYDYRKGMDDKTSTSIGGQKRTFDTLVGSDGTSQGQGHLGGLIDAAGGSNNFDDIINPKTNREIGYKDGTVGAGVGGVGVSGHLYIPSSTEADSLRAINTMEAGKMSNYDNSTAIRSAGSKVAGELVNAITGGKGGEEDRRIAEATTAVPENSKAQNYKGVQEGINMMQDRVNSSVQILRRVYGVGPDGKGGDQEGLKAALDRDGWTSLQQKINERKQQLEDNLGVNARSGRIADYRTGQEAKATDVAAYRTQQAQGAQDPTLATSQAASPNHTGMPVPAQGSAMDVLRRIGGANWMPSGW